MIENRNEILLIITNIISDYIKGLSQLPTCQLSTNKNKNNNYYVSIIFVNMYLPLRLPRNSKRLFRVVFELNSSD